MPYDKLICMRRGMLDVHRQYKPDGQSPASGGSLHHRGTAALCVTHRQQISWRRQSSCWPLHLLSYTWVYRAYHRISGHVLGPGYATREGVPSTSAIAIDLAHEYSSQNDGALEGVITWLLDTRPSPI
jgi:hypothetical protein